MNAAGDGVSPEDPGDADLEALLAHIKEQRAFDFTGYKRASLERRIRRRWSRWTSPPTTATSTTW